MWADLALDSAFANRLVEVALAEESCSSTTKWLVFAREKVQVGDAIGAATTVATNPSTTVLQLDPDPSELRWTWEI